MEQIGFIGALDKKDLLLNIGKVLTNLNKSVLIVDATMAQRLRYVVPNTSSKPSNTYVSEYQGVDVAVGFMNLNSIAQFIGHNINYDYVIIDTDAVQTVTSFGMQNFAKNFFITSYDEYELQKGIEIFRLIQFPIELYKVIISSNINNKEDEYLNYLLGQTTAKWKEEKILFADTINDRKAALENQLTKEVNLKKYTSTYKDSLEYLISIITDGTLGDLKRMIRKM